MPPVSYLTSTAQDTTLSPGTVRTTKSTGEVDSSEVGLLNLGWSTSPPFVERLDGSETAFKEYFPDGTVIEGDGVTVGSLDAETGYNLTSQFMTANPDIKYWIIFGCVEDYAQGAARYAETTSNPDNILITCSGSNILPLEFESGYEGSWKVCYAVSDISYAGPAAVGLIAIVDGRATEESLWSCLLYTSTGGDLQGIKQSII